MTQRDDPAPTPGDRKSSRPYVVLALLTAVYTFNFMDRQLLSILAEPIKRDMGLSDTQLGLLGGIFFALFYTTLGIPIAWLADQTSRIRIIGIACAVWSLFSTLCGFAGNFWQLALARIGVGAGEAGGSPPAHSIISDYFPPARRGTALAIYSLGVPIGILLSSLVGGAIASAFGWRTAFIAIGAPGILLAVIAVAVIREPPRGRFDEGARIHSSGPVSLGRSVRLFLSEKTLIIAASAATASAFVSYALTWMPAFLIRNKDMDLGEMAVWFSLVNGVGSMVGTFASGWITDRLAVRHPGAYGLVPCAAHLLSLPLFLCALWAPNWQIALLFYLVPAALANAFLPAGLAIVQNGVGASQRATASALLLFMLNLIGLGGGPLFIGLISDWAAPHWGEESLTLALAALAPLFLVAAALQFWAAKAIAKGRVSLSRSNDPLEAQP